MAFWPRYVRDEFSSLQPVFRFMDDYANQIISGSGRECAGLTGQLTRFQPRFNVKENADSYELQGELPGLEQKDVNIEFTDPQTLVIKGTSEQVREESERPTAAVKGEAAQSKLTESDTDSDKGKQATVEDEDYDVVDPAATEADQSTEQSTEQPTKQSSEAVQQQPEQSKSTYWLREMSRGEFSRTFAFSSRVDHDGVRASLKNGILSIVVPKAPVPQIKRVNIE